MPEDPNTQIIWLASYPRSGNTWIRFLLANLIFGKPETSLDVEQSIPDIHFCLSGFHGVTVEDLLLWDTVLCKTHFKFSPQMPLAQYTSGFIYIIRNPIDVMMSSFNYYLLKIGDKLPDMTDETIGKHLDRYIDSFLTRKGDPTYIEFGFGNIIEHFESWLGISKQFPNLVIRYEDLLSSPKAKSREICNFLDLNVDEAEIESAIENSSFSEMKKLEEKAISTKERGMFYHPAYEAAHKQGVRFINRGKSGWGKEALSTEQLEYAKKVFKPVLNQFNYK